MFASAVASLPCPVRHVASIRSSPRPANCPGGRSQVNPARGLQSIRASAAAGDAEIKALSYKNLMVTIFDANPYLSEGTRQALVTASQLAGVHSSKITVVVVDDKDKGSQEENAQKLTNIHEYMAQTGCSDFNVIEKLTTENHSALVGNVAEEMNADMVVIHSDSVHEHSVDANLLAEFVPCSTLLLP